MTAGVDDGQTLPDGGGHDVEPAADLRDGGGREHVATAFGQRGHLHQEIDDRLAGEQQAPQRRLARLMSWHQALSGGSRGPQGVQIIG